MQLDTGLRTRLAERTIQSLERCVPGSRATFRGSLASGRADALSDIDLLWQVPDALFDSAVAAVRTALEAVIPLESLRPDPDAHGCSKKNLCFARFEGVPLFWRLDLEIVAQSIAGEAGPAEGDPGSIGTGPHWPFTESALMNAVLAVKWTLRNNEEAAAKSLARAYRRVDLPVPGDMSSANVGSLVARLARQVAAMDESQQALAGRVIELLAEYSQVLFRSHFVASE